MKLLAIDGNSILNRAFYGIKLLTNKKGEFTNAIFGFMNIYLRNVGDIRPNAVAVAFDLRTPTLPQGRVLVQGQPQGYASRAGRAAAQSEKASRPHGRKGSGM